MGKWAMILGLILAMVGCADPGATVTIRLNPENNSGISGTAQLIPTGNQTRVVITEKGEPSGASEPAHIHAGQCGPTLGKIVYPLKNVEDGTSETTVNAPLSAVTSGQYAINVHESAKNLGTTVACGNIPTR
ncbi:MAG TPA: hypothetical protein VNL16_05425 [Chloroflexota bacterium]|nr:hypothetical protein [Chloroflexota bacterium]